MRKFAYVFMIAVVAIFLSYEGKAACTPASISYTTAGGCVMTINFCYECDPTAATKINITMGQPSWDASDANCSNAPSYLAAAAEAAFDYCIANDLCVWPECPQSAANAKIEMSVCAKVINVGATHTSYLSFDCEDDAKCITLYKVCRAIGLPGQPVIKTIVSRTPTGTATCSTTEPTRPPTGKTVYDDWTVGCWNIGCE